jgi:hypothetical protein
MKSRGDARNLQETLARTALSVLLEMDGVFCRETKGLRAGLVGVGSWPA